MTAIAIIITNSSR